MLEWHIPGLHLGDKRFNLVDVLHCESVEWTTTEARAPRADRCPYSQLPRCNMPRKPRLVCGYVAIVCHINNFRLSELNKEVNAAYRSVSAIQLHHWRIICKSTSKLSPAKSPLWGSQKIRRAYSSEENGSRLSPRGVAIILNKMGTNYMR